MIKDGISGLLGEKERTQIKKRWKWESENQNKK